MEERAREAQALPPQLPGASAPLPGLRWALAGEPVGTGPDRQTVQVGKEHLADQVRSEQRGVLSRTRAATGQATHGLSDGRCPPVKWGFGDNSEAGKQPAPFTQESREAMPLTSVHTGRPRLPACPVPAAPGSSERRPR